MKIYVVRHGVTKNNKLGLINGSGVDESLEPEGFKQAEEAISKIPKGVTRMFVSDMLRTKQTADVINKELNLPVSFHPELKEVHFGQLAGKSWINIEKEGLASRQKYLDIHYDFTSHGGESAEQVKTRLRKMIEKIKEEYPNESVLIVAHGGVLRALYSMYKNEKMDYIENASVHEFDV
jgi:broad specificity phosphatase PhoE